MLPLIYDHLKGLDAREDATDLGGAALNGDLVARAVDRRAEDDDRWAHRSATMVADEEAEGAEERDEQEASTRAAQRETAVPNITALRLRVRAGFVPLWHDLLHLGAPLGTASAPVVCGAAVPPSATLAASNAVYDELVRTALTRLKRLDLALATPDVDTTRRDASASDGVERDAEGDAPPPRPRSTRDYADFLALVELLTNVLATRRRLRLVHWLPFFLETTIELARTFPHASGLLKLIEFAIRAADELQFFCRTPETRAALGGGDGHAAFCASQLRDFLSRDVATQTSQVSLFCLPLHCCECCSQFDTPPVTLFAHTSQRSDELLVVSLRCILAAPPALCLDATRVVVPALIAALQLGLRHAPIASAALDALERALRGGTGGVVDAADTDGACTLATEKNLTRLEAHLRVYLGTDGKGERAEGALGMREGAGSYGSGGSGSGGAAGGAQQLRISRAAVGTVAAKKRSRAKLVDAVSAATIASAATAGARKLRHRVLRVLGLISGGERRRGAPSEAALAASSRWTRSDEVCVKFELGSHKHQCGELAFDAVLPR